MPFRIWLEMKLTATQVASPVMNVRAQHPWPVEGDVKSSVLDLTPEEKIDLSRICDVIDFKTDGPPIFLQGQNADHIFYVEQGIVQGRHTIRTGVRQSVALYWPGDFLGLAREGLFFNSAEAVIDCLLYRFPIRRLEGFLVSHPRIQHKFLMKAVHDVRKTQRQLIIMGALDVTRRLAIFLVDCCAHREHFNAKTQLLTIPISRQDIADHIGTSAETVTRAMNVLEKKHLIRRQTPWKLEIKTSELLAFSSLD